LYPSLWARAVSRDVTLERFDIDEAFPAASDSLP
jgi:hypothetical protein